MRCSSLDVPSVTTPRDCVSPRVNSADPCVLGSTPTSQSIARTSSAPRPSARAPSSRMRARTLFFSSDRTTSCTSLSGAGDPGSSSARLAEISLAIAASAADRSVFPLIFTASATRGAASSSTRLRSPGSTCLGSHSIAGTRRGAISSSWISISSLIASWATLNPSRISVSGTWIAPPSTITIALAEPATTMSTSAYSSWRNVGLTTQLPWIRPMRTDATGVRNGMTEVFSATEAPISVSTSASFSWSALRTWA